jgi:AcrR family transcriptional regulator
MTRDERRTRTRQDLVEAAERLFTTGGFHATSVDAVADAAGYTKGAVYSNFASKEELFLAVYERRAAGVVEVIETTLASASDPISGVEALSRAAVDRRGRGADDGWLAVFFEFWAHVLRHPELRARFAEIHRSGAAPVVAAVEQLVADHGIEPEQPVDRMVAAYNALQLGLQLERLTQPDLIDSELAGHIARRSLEDMVRGGADGRHLPAQANRGRGRRTARGAGARRS